MGSSEMRAKSFEQDLLWSVLDQDAVPHILAMAKDHWNIDSAQAWNALVQQASLGRLRAYHGTDTTIAIDLRCLSEQEAASDYELFVEPSDATRLRLAEIQ